MQDEKATLPETQLQELLLQHYAQRRKRARCFKKAIAAFGVLLFASWFFYSKYPNPRLIGCTGSHGGDSDPRRQHIETGLHPLKGEFNVLDLLSIHSTAGLIDVVVHPEPADEKKPAAAELIIESLAGNVGLIYPALDAPDREYRTLVNSRAGSIRADILHGLDTSIVSYTGSIMAELTLYAADDYNSSLKTFTAFGSQKVLVQPPIEQPDARINSMASAHFTKIGSLELRYPKEWEGTIEAYTRTGSLQLHGSDLDIIRDNCTHNRPGLCIFAKKGNGKSTLVAHTGTGSVDVYFE